MLGDIWYAKGEECVPCPRMLFEFKEDGSLGPTSLSSMDTWVRQGWRNFSGRTTYKKGRLIATGELLWNLTSSS